MSERKPTLTADEDGGPDYTLNDPDFTQAAWITIPAARPEHQKDITLYIKRCPEGVIVEAYPREGEMDNPTFSEQMDYPLKEEEGGEDDKALLEQATAIVAEMTEEQCRHWLVTHDPEGKNIWLKPSTRDELAGCILDNLRDFGLDQSDIDNLQESKRNPMKSLTKDQGREALFKLKREDQCADVHCAACDSTFEVGLLDEGSGDLHDTIEVPEFFCPKCEANSDAIIIPNDE